MRRTILESFFSQTYALFSKFWKRSVPRFVQAGNHADHFAYDFRFVWQIPRFRRATRRRVRLHHQIISRLVKPAATVTISDVNGIHWPAVLRTPTFVFDSAQFRLYQNQTSRTQDRHHPSVTEADIPIAMPRLRVDQSALTMN